MTSAAELSGRIARLREDGLEPLQVVLGREEWRDIVSDPSAEAKEVEGPPHGFTIDGVDVELVDEPCGAPIVYQGGVDRA